MEVNIHVRSKKFNNTTDFALQEYIKRTRSFCRLSIVFHKPGDKSFGVETKQKGSCAFFVVPGKSTISSTDFAGLISGLNLNGISRISFYLTTREELTSMSNVTSSEIFSVSSFDMSKEMTAIVLAEQIYRAYTILNNITYHK